MAIIYSAYNDYDHLHSKYETINNSLEPYTSSAGWVKLLYLPDGGITVTGGGAVYLYRCDDITTAYLPDGSKIKVRKDFVNAQNVNILNGGELYLHAGAVASNTIIKQGTENVLYDWSFTSKVFEAEPPVRAESYDAQIYDGGKQTVKGGYTYGTIIHSGGIQTVGEGGMSKLVEDSAGSQYYKQFEAEGIAENTIILQGGTQTVKTGGAVYNTKVNGGTMDIQSGYAVDTVVHSGTLNASRGATLHNVTFSQQSTVDFRSGSTLEGYLLAAKSFTVASNINTEKLDFCIDLSGMTDRTMTVLNKNMYDNLSNSVDYYVHNSVSDEMADADTKNFTYNIINVGGEFDETISILNMQENIAGEKTYSVGNQLVLNEEVYDLYGNGYILRYDSTSKNYTIDFTNNTISDFLDFSDGSSRASGELTGAQNNNSGLYSVNLNIYDPEQTLTATERMQIFISLNGTVDFYKNNVLIGSQTIEQGIVTGEKIFSAPVADGQLCCKLNLNSNYDTDKDFSIKAILTNVSLDNSDNEDNSWQSLPAQSTVFTGKKYIFDFEKSGTVNISNEYTGASDNTDYRQLNITHAGLLNISADLRSINNVGSDVTVNVYQAVNDGSKLKKILSAAGSVSNSTLRFPEVLVDKGIYYIEIKAGNSSFINWDLQASVKLFDTPDASTLDDSALLAEKNYDSTELNETFSDWTGPSDTVDYRELDIEQPGRYTLSFGKSESSNSTVKLEVLEIYNGKQKVISKQTIKADVESYTTKDFFINPVDGAKYFVRVTDTTAAKGSTADYQITLNGTTFNADNSDDTAQNAANAEDFEDNYIIKDEYIGYGDLTDFYKFEVSDAGQYSFTVESEDIKGAKVTLYRLYDDGKEGTVPLQSVATLKTPSLFNRQDDIYYANTENITLMEGTYYLKITGGNKSNDSKNTSYSVKVNAAAFADFAQQQEFKSGETYVLTVDEYTSLKSDLFKKFTITQDNGKNKPVKITAAYETILAPGTYYFSTSMQISAGDVTLNSAEKYQNAVITDNNSWKNAADITDGVQNQWVGYGDGIDYYRCTITADNAGKTVFTLSPDYVNNCSITLYRVQTDKNGVQSLVKASYKFKNNTITADNLIAGEYYIAVSSKSYASDAKAKNTSYDLTIEHTPYQQISEGISPTLAKNEYAVLNFDGEGVYYADFYGTNYTLYKDNGKGGFAKVNVYNNSAMLDANEVYYIKSSADNNKIVFKAEAIEPKDGQWHLGLNNASDSYEFDTFGSEGAMTLFTLENISGTVSANTKFTVTVYQEVNGAWKKVSSANASYNAKTYKETAANLAVSLAADSKYKVEVSSSDKGAGTCAGYFDFTQQTFEYDYGNNTFQSADDIDGEIQSAVAKKGDSVDFYCLDNSKNFSLALDTEIAAKAAVKLTFYDENYNVVKFMSNGKSVANLTLNAKNNEFLMADVSDNIKFVRIDASGANLNAYTITQA